MSRNCRIKSQQNKGFSLLELLIAMAILGIIVAPLLHLFVVGARTNQKAREVIRATTAAQNTMEELKSNSLADTLRLVNGYNVDENGKVLTSTFGEMTIGSKYEVTNMGGVWTQTDAATSAITPSYTPVTDATTGAVTNTLTKTTFAGGTSSYSILLKDVKEGNSHYDEVVTYTPDVTHKTLENAAITSMNQEDCGYFVQAVDEVTSAASEFANRNITYRNTSAGATAAVMSESDFQSIMQKAITVDINKDASNGSVTVGISCEYTVLAGYTTSEDRVYEGDGGSVFNNYGKTDTTPLKAIYIYYYPNYTLASSLKDKIIINNTSNVDAAVYLIAMNNGPGYTTSNASTYTMDLQVNEGSVVSGATTLHTTICTNLKATQISRRSNITGLAPTIKDLGNLTSQQIYYNVSVTVYKHDDASFGTSGSSAVTFTPDSDNYVTEFTGAILDNSVIN